MVPVHTIHQNQNVLDRICYSANSTTPHVLHTPPSNTNYFSLAVWWPQKRSPQFIFPNASNRSHQQQPTTTTTTHQTHSTNVEKSHLQSKGQAIRAKVDPPVQQQEINNHRCRSPLTTATKSMLLLSCHCRRHQ